MQQSYGEEIQTSFRERGGWDLRKCMGDETMLRGVEYSSQGFAKFCVGVWERRGVCFINNNINCIGSNSSLSGKRRFPFLKAIVLTKSYYVHSDENISLSAKAVLKELEGKFVPCSLKTFSLLNSRHLDRHHIVFSDAEWDARLHDFFPRSCFALTPSSPRKHAH